MNPSPPSQTLLINHIGYDNHDIKKVVFQTTLEHFPETFSIINSKNEKVFEGKFEKGCKIDKWHTGKASAGYFTDFKDEGEFQIIVQHKNQKTESQCFKISPGIIQKSCLHLLLEGFQSQHPEKKYEDRDNQIQFFGKRKSEVDVHGGWYDASGDVSKYLSHLSYANFLNPQQTPLVVWSMFEVYQNLKLQSSFSEKFINDLLTEAFYGAEFLVRMQDQKGYFYMTIFDTWSKEPEKREICAYKGQDGIRSEKYQAGFRQGGGMAIAALAHAGRVGYNENFIKEIFVEKAIKGFDHLLKYNLKYIDDGIENIIDDYCFLLASVELFKTTKDKMYLNHARKRSHLLINRLSTDYKYYSWWRADEKGKRPFFHASDAGMPLVALNKYLEVENLEIYRDPIILGIQTSVDNELRITNEVVNPFGYPRQLVKGVNESASKSSFFVPHKNESGYWWQGENARIASLSTAMQMSMPFLRDDQKTESQQYASNQVNWILGLNPYDTCMLDGIGYNNPVYKEPENVNYRGGICNGITSGFENESDIAFMPLPYNDDPAQQWRWSEQWIPHAAWFMLAISFYE